MGPSARQDMSPEFRVYFISDELLGWGQAPYEAYNVIRRVPTEASGYQMLSTPLYLCVQRIHFNDSRFARSHPRARHGPIDQHHRLSLPLNFRTVRAIGLVC